MATNEKFKNWKVDVDETQKDAWVKVVLSRIKNQAPYAVSFRSLVANVPQSEQSDYYIALENAVRRHNNAVRKQDHLTYCPNCPIGAKYIIISNQADSYYDKYYQLKEWQSL